MKIFVYGFANTSLFFNEVFKYEYLNNTNIEWGIIYPTANYKDLTNNVIKKENIFYLYENFNSLYNNKKRNMIEYNFKIDSSNIHRLIVGSKNGYKKYAKKKQEKNANIIYELYKEYLIKVQPDYMIFPDLEVVDGLILLNICKELKIEVLYTVHTRLLGESFFAQDPYETLPKYFGSYEPKDILKSESFMDLLKQNKIKAYNKADFGDEIIKIEIPNIIQRFINVLCNKYKYEKNIISEINFVTRILILLPRIHQLYRNLKFKIFQKKYFEINSSFDEIPENFILFPLQMTPESSINTLEQYFLEQEKLIDLVRLNMPHNFTLLVKEHGVMNGFRASSFYKSLSSKSGVILVQSSLDTQKLIEKSKLVVTITGTVGLETYLKNKKILIFGPTFFSHLCARFDSYLNLSKIIYDLISNKNKNKNENMLIEIAKIYNVSYKFILNDPIFHKEVMSESNIVNFVDALKEHIKRLSND